MLALAAAALKWSQPSIAQQTVFVPSCSGNVTTDTAALTALKATIGVTNLATIELPGKIDPTKQCKLNTFIFTSNITVNFTNGGLQGVTGQTVTIQGPIVAPRAKRFYNFLPGQATISLSGNKGMGALIPQWWETVPTSVGIQAAINAATTAGAGRVVVPAGQTYVLGSTGLTINSDYVTLEGEAQQVFMTYSGSGIGIDVTNQYDHVANIYVITSNAAATGIRFKGVSRFCSLIQFTAQYDGTLTGNLPSTGIGIDLDANAGSTDQFSGELHIDQVYSLNNKYGIRVRNTNAGVIPSQQSWTTIHGGQVVLVGPLRGSTIDPVHPTYPLVGSIGLWTDDKTNGEGSSIDNLLLERFSTGVQFDECAGCNGFFHIAGGMEGNGPTGNSTGTEPPFIPSATWNGEFYNAHGGGFYVRGASNGLNNLWERSKRLNGDWFEENFGDKLDVQYDGNTTQLLWGLKRGGSIINNEFAADKFVVGTGGAAGVGVDQNWFKFLQYKQSWAFATPDRGSWERGSFVWNSNAGLAMTMGWVCATSGTLNKTITAATTAATTSGLATVTLNQATNISQDDYITIAGVTGVFRVKFITDSTHIILSGNADATVAAGAVAYSPASFLALPKVSDPGIVSVVTPTVATSNTTLANVANLALLVSSGVTYRIEADLETTSNSSGGVKVGITCTCTVSGVSYSAIISDGSTSFTSRTTTLGNAVGGITAVQNAHIRIIGEITTTSAGSVKVQFAQNASNGSASTVLAHSIFKTDVVR